MKLQSSFTFDSFICCCDGAASTSPPCVWGEGQICDISLCSVPPTLKWLITVPASFSSLARGPRLINTWKCQHPDGDIKSKVVNNIMYVLLIIWKRFVWPHTHLFYLYLCFFFFRRSSLLILLSTLLLDFLPFYYLLCVVMFGSFVGKIKAAVLIDMLIDDQMLLHTWITDFCPTKKLSLSQPQTVIVQQIHTHKNTCIWRKKIQKKKKKLTERHTQNSTRTQMQFHKAHQLQTAQSRFHFAVHLQAFPVRGFDIHTSLGQPAAESPASAQWFGPKRPALWKKRACFIWIISSFFFPF